MQASSNFNIITGEVLQRSPQQRFKSAQHLTKSNKFTLPYLKLRGLGTSIDKNAFKYSYIDQSTDPQINTQHSPYKDTTLNFTFQNCDLITHRKLNPATPILRHQDFQNSLNSVKRQGILTKHIDKAIMYAPNYHQEYESRVQNHQFNRRKQLCGETAEIQKSYGVHKYFRYFK